MEIENQLAKEVNRLARRVMLLESTIIAISRISEEDNDSALNQIRDLVHNYEFAADWYNEQEMNNEL